MGIKEKSTLNKKKKIYYYFGVDIALSNDRIV